MVYDLVSPSSLCNPVSHSALLSEQPGMACLANLHITTPIVKMRSLDVDDPSAVCHGFSIFLS